MTRMRGECKQSLEHGKERLRAFSVGGAEKHTGADDPRHTLQECGGLADCWYLDDGTPCVVDALDVAGVSETSVGTTCDAS